MKKKKPKIKPEIMCAIWNPDIGFYEGTWTTKKAAIEAFCSKGNVWSTSKKYFGDRAVKVEIREVKND